jgi:tripeptide aminopeptidase
LDQQGIVWEDDGTAVKTGSNVGNIIVASPGDARLAFNAHMDTIQIFEKKNPLLAGTVVKAEGGGILGIDDMSGMAAVLELAASLQENGGIPPDIHFLFNVAEERGFRGIWALDPRHFINAFTFVIDSGGVPLIRVVRRGVGQISFTVSVHGIMGHASLQSGKNAAVFSAKLITQLKPGKAKKDSFIHIGSIDCPGNPNTTPDLSVINGQIHFFDEEESSAIVLEMKEIVEKFAKEEDCKVDFNTVQDCLPWAVSDDDPIIVHAKEAAEKASLPFYLNETRSGSDAQVIHQRGGRVIKISTGMLKPHSKEESIDLEDLKRCADYLWHLAAIPVILSS